MALRLYNTLTRQKAEFQPIDPNNVRMYVCGPTVYDFAHIGNARPVIVFDVLFRLLRHIYGEDHVTYVRNITDVDDKINARALRDFPGLPLNDAIRQVTEKTADQFHADVKALGCLEPTVEPRATDFVLPRTDRKQSMTGMIQTLLDRENAYLAYGAEGREILFDVMSMPDYGRLSQRNLDEQQAGARVEVEAHKKNPADFVLWKESGAKEPGWNGEFVPNPKGGYDAEFKVSRRNASSLGLNSRVVAIHGRPGWHIECSAMSSAYLGEVFDIHGGGLDLIFPHHENEIAQSRCAHGTDEMANVWMHNGFLQVEGEKMSKSLGNFVTINELLTGWRGLNWPGQIIRFAMLMTHYRQPLDFTQGLLDQAWVALSAFDFTLKPDDYQTVAPSYEFIDALMDDLNTPRAIAELHRLNKEARECLPLPSPGGSIRILEPENFINVPARQLAAGLNMLGVDIQGYDRDWPKKQSDIQKIESLIAARSVARSVKDFKEGDRIRDELSKMGIALKDTKNKDTGEIETTWEVMR